MASLLDRVHFLVSPVGGSLPDVPSIQRYFQQWLSERVTVEHVKEGPGNMLTVLWIPYNIYLEYFSDKVITVDGHEVRMRVLVPDVYGCDVFITEDHVEVSVGRDLIQRLMSNKEGTKTLLSLLTYDELVSASVRFVSDGILAVTRLSPVKAFDKWAWELFTIDCLINYLRPFKASFPARSISVRDRCIDRRSSRLMSAQHFSSPDSEDVRAHTFIKCDRRHFAIIWADPFLEKIRAEYPELQFICNEAEGTLEVCGQDDSMQKALESRMVRLNGLSVKIIPLTDTQAKKMEKTDGQNWFQQSLNAKEIQCFWEFHNLPYPRARSFSKSTCKESIMAVKVTGSELNIKMFERVLQSCFQTVKVTLGKNQVVHLKSDSWKQFLNDLQKPRENGTSPVLTVEQNKIGICDLESNIETTQRSVLDFFYRSLIDPHGEFCSQKVTKTIRKLKPWQVKLLAAAQDKKHLPSVLQEIVSINSELHVVQIQAPFCRIDERVGDFWNYVVDLSQRVIPLTAASTQALSVSDKRERVQNRLDKESIVCHWHVEHGQLTISAHDSHMQQVVDIFTSEVQTAQLSCGSQTRYQEEKESPTDNEVITSEREQEIDDHCHQDKEQQTGHLATEDKQTQSENRTDEKESQTENGNMRTEQKQTRTWTWIMCQEDRRTDREQRTDYQHCQDTEQQTNVIHTEDRLTQTKHRSEEKEMQTEDNIRSADEKLTQTCIGHQQNRAPQTTTLKAQAQEETTQVRSSNHHDQPPDENAWNTNYADSSRGLLVQNTNVEMRNDHTVSQMSRERVTDGGQAEKAGRPQPTFEHPPVDTEPSDTCDDQSRQDPQGMRSWLSCTQTVQPSSRDLTRNSLDFQRSHVSSGQFFNDVSDHPQTASEEDSSSTCLKTVVTSSQEGRARNTVDTSTSTGDLCPLQQPCLSPRDQGTQTSTPLNQRQHIQHRSHSSFSTIPVMSERVLQSSPAPIPQQSGVYQGYHGNINSNYNLLQLQLNSSVLARLTQLEARDSVTRRERAQEPAVPLENRVVNIQQQLDQMMQMQTNTLQQANASESDQLVIGNGSESLSTSSESSEQSQLSQQQQQQQQHQPHLERNRNLFCTLQ